VPEHPEGGLIGGQAHDQENCTPDRFLPSLRAAIWWAAIIMHCRWGWLLSSARPWSTAGRGTATLPRSCRVKG